MVVENINRENIKYNKKERRKKIKGCVNISVNDE